jgi:hypothetical protein
MIHIYIIDVGLNIIKRHELIFLKEDLT